MTGKADNIFQEDNMDLTFEKRDFIEKQLSNTTFDNCKFNKCNFSDSKFISCKFIDCEFIECNMSLTDVSQSAFIETVFDSSKMIGINWTQVKWPYIQLSSPIRFYKCDISHASFYGLSLTEIVIEECKAHEVDFRECNLSHANMSYTDFSRSQFVNTKLISADFSEAINYNINIEHNDITKATFTFPECTNLLNCLDIKINGFELSN